MNYRVDRKGKVSFLTFEVDGIKHEIKIPSDLSPEFIKQIYLKYKKKYTEENMAKKRKGGC